MKELSTCSDRMMDNAVKEDVAARVTYLSCNQQRIGVVVLGKRDNGFWYEA